MNKPKKVVWYKNPFQWLTLTPKGNLGLLVGAVCVPTSMMLHVCFLEASWGWESIGYLLLPSWIAALLLWMSVGNPLKWWQPFFGHEVLANMEKIANRERAGETAASVAHEIRNWVKTMATSSWCNHKHHPYKYQFLKKSDAVMFKLTWG